MMENERESVRSGWCAFLLITASIAMCAVLAACEDEGTSQSSAEVGSSGVQDQITGPDPDWLVLARLDDHFADLDQTVQQLIDELNDDGTEHLVVLQDLARDEEWMYDLHYVSPEQWFIKAREEEETAFEVTYDGRELSDERTVVVAFDDQEEAYPAETFELMFPVAHLQIIQEALRQERYGRLSWTKAAEKVHLHLDTSADLLEDLFHTYLSGHLQDEAQTIGLASYRIDYVLTFPLYETDEIVLGTPERLEFRLRHDHHVLEHLHYGMEHES